MSRRVSNTATRKEIEEVMQCKFLYPNLYSPSPIINGKKESTLSVITSEDPESISFAIWGMLPSNFDDEWTYFQDARDTLSVETDNVDSLDEYSEALKVHRCLIIVTGYFIYHLSDGTLYPYYIYEASQKPFCLAGIYNTLKDGFKTCTFLKTNATGVVASIQNVDKTMPVVIDRSDYAKWLDPDTPEEVISQLLKKNDHLNLKGHPIAKEFFKNEIVYDGVLEPVAYPNVPMVD